MGLVKNIQAVLGSKQVQASGTPDMKYIVENLKMLEEYELSNIERSLKKKDINQRTELYADDRGNISSLDMTVNLMDPIDKILQQIEQKRGAEYGHLDFKAFSKLNGIVKHYYFRHVVGDQYKMSGDYNLASLLNFIIYIVNGKVEPNYVRVYQDLEKAGQKGLEYQPAFDLTYLGVKIKKYKNNRIDVKFPKPEQAKKCQETIEQWDKAKVGR